MENLKLLNNGSEDKIETEFYTKGDPLRFLGNIENINIIIGANNSRKSRFLRQIIRLESRILLTTTDDLNLIYHKGLNLIEQIQFIQNNTSGAIIGITYLNHSGKKSVILKKYFEELDNKDRIIDANSINILLKSLLDSISYSDNQKLVESFHEELNYLDTICGLITYLYTHLQNSGNKYVSELSYPDSEFRYIGPTIPQLNRQDFVPMIPEILAIVADMDKWCKTLSKIELSKQGGKNIYIPALRTSRNLVGIETDIFEDTIRNQHFKDLVNETLEIHTGLKLYEKIDYARNGNTAERVAFSEFERFIGLTFFKSEGVHIIAYKSKERKTNEIKVTIPAQKADVPIYDLGEGIQGIINLLFPIFTAYKDDWIYIDEPENHLHPGYQNIFINAISENDFLKAKNLKFFINTHSNHILTEVFLSNTRNTTFIFDTRDENSSSIKIFEQDHYNTLELLGVMNTSVFITNCTVWVEGISDRLYIRAFLHAYLSSISKGAYRPNEGFDFSFIEYAGKNLVHYDFDNSENDNIASYFINSNVFVLADSDFDVNKHKKYNKINRKNFLYCQTEVPEIENLLPESVLKDFFLDKVKCDSSSLDNIFHIKKRKLGTIFDGLTKGGKKIAVLAKHGGTLSPYYKSLLSKYAFEEIMNGSISWEALSQSNVLNNIITKLYNFIKLSNRK